VTVPGYGGFLRKATKFDGVVDRHPFILLAHLPNAKVVKADCFEIRHYTFSGFLIPQLISLELKFVYLWSYLDYDDFKTFFVAFPNLLSLTLTINVPLVDFDEKDFVRFLADNKAKFAKLRRLRKV
jgi:hypothetical protein